MRKRRIRNNSWENLSGFRYAHRGFFIEPKSASKRGRDAAGKPYWTGDINEWKRRGKKIVPENSMSAFRLAVKYGFGSELDVRLASDGALPVVHDSRLFRISGVDASVEELSTEDICKIRLFGTEEGIPVLSSVLDLYTSSEAMTDRTDYRNGQPLHLPLIIELKAEQNVRELCAKVMDVIDRYPSLNYCIESFDPRVVLWFRRRRPDVIRGQLTENFMKSREAVRDWGHLMTFGMWSVVPNLLSRPDFISCKFRDRRNIFIRLSHLMGVRQVNWTIRDECEMRIVDSEGGLSIFENFLPLKTEKKAQNRNEEKSFV